MSRSAIAAPAAPGVRLCLGVAGHRADHPSYGPRAARIAAAMARVLDLIDAALAAVPGPFGAPLAPSRMHSMLADGADQIAAREALARGWDLVAPLPFGRALNCAINAHPHCADDARALAAGGAPADPAVAARAAAIHDLAGKAQVFELADADAEIAAAFLAMHDTPGDMAKADIFRADSSARVALAARIVIEQSDLLIAVWDGARTSFVGGTGHTVAAALELGAPVIWIDPAAPEDWRILGAPEALVMRRVSTVQPDRERALARIVADAVSPRPAVSRNGGAQGVAALDARHWRTSSNRLWHSYRRVEAVFGGDKRNPFRALTQTYEPPAAIAAGSASGLVTALRMLPSTQGLWAERIVCGVLSRFAWADGISAHLSDAYRGGMVVNFALSALAVISGVAYLPLVDTAWKWPFAAFEVVLLCAILGITWFGQKRRWHGRWFETRRVAEYLRHAPLGLALGVGRAPGRWPRGADTSWPEHYARHAIREAGLPQARVTQDYLRAALRDLIAPHVAGQRAYHHHKAKRLTAVHHNLDRLSERAFQLALACAGVYLAVTACVALGVAHKDAAKSAAKIFTFLGVALPTFGGGLAGIRFFGDFERFAAISEVTAGKLEAVEARLGLILAAPDAPLDYQTAADLADAVDEIVVSEIENWQAVFAAKQITVPA